MKAMQARAGRELFATLVFAAASVTYAQPLVRPGDGVVDGVAAIAAWPCRPDGQTCRPLDPTGCTAHLIPESEVKAELVYPCGTWFVPPEDRYLLWLEHGWEITPTQAVVAYARRPAIGDRGKGFLLPIGPAGRVRSPGGASPKATVSLRLLALDGAFSRRVPASGRAAGALVPAGAVLAALWDDAMGSYVALARPVTVPAGASVDIVPSPPAPPLTDLLVRLDSPGTPLAGGDLALRLRGGAATPLEPNLVVREKQRVFAAWYGLHEKRAAIELVSDDYWLPTSDTTLPAGGVAFEALRLRPNPRLTVKVEVPPDVNLGKCDVVVTTEKAEEVRRSSFLPSESTQAVISLPPVPLRVVLRSPPWSFSEEVDLRDGGDREVVFRPEVCRISGAVFLGKKEHEAHLAFATGGEGQYATTDTDDAGAYHITLLSRGYFLVRITIPGRPAVVQRLARMLQDGERVDFHLQANNVEVEILDAESGTPLDDSVVRCAISESGGGRHLATLTTGSDGVARLEPLPPGELRIIAEATGYLRSELAPVTITEETDTLHLTVRLKPLKETVSLRLQLATGAPAAGASVALLTDTINGPLWSGSADAAGVIAVPSNLTARWIAAVHPAAGFLLLPWDTLLGETVQRLPEQASPLVVRVTDSTGTGLPWAPIGVVWRGTLLTNVALAWLTNRGAPAADANGLWTCTGLPREPIVVIATRMGRSDPLANLLAAASQGVTVTYPWLAPVEVRCED